MSATAAVAAPESTGGREPQATAVTPTVRGFLRRWSFWLIAAAFVLVASVILLLVRGGATASADPLSISSAAPSGSKALAEVLRQHGVAVTAANSLDEAEAAVKAARGSGLGSAPPTLLIYDPQQLLPGDRYSEVANLGARLVLVQPDVFELEALQPAISLAGAPDGAADNSTTVPAGCALPAAVRAGTITVSGTTYRATDAGTNVVSCFEAGGDAYSVVAAATGKAPVTVLGAPDILNNETIASAGNAALALGLLGQSPSLIWYTPTAADVSATGPPSLQALTPGWVTPFVVLLALVFVAAAVWRGRRLGPVVVENLPVVVRANETVTGRARLYARSGATTRALDALRIGTAGRLGRMLGLPQQASLDEIILQSAVVSRLPIGEVAAILVNELPRSDPDLLRLSQRLAELESAVRARVYGGRRTGETGSAGDG